MNKTKIILISAVAIITVFLFAKGYKSSVKEVDTDKATTAQIPEFNMDVFIDQKYNGLAPELKEVNDKLKSDNTKESLQSLVLLWDSIDAHIAAYYFKQYTSLVPTEQNYYILGTKFLGIAATDADSSKMFYSGSMARSAFEKVLEMNPNNLDAKVGLATCKVELDGEVMGGVSLLREVIEKDSNNIQAIYTLGILSMRSTQYDKAIVRFEKLVQLQPFNAEFYFYLGEAYAKYGETDKAIRTYEKCKTLLNDKESKKEVEKIIEQLNNI